MASSWLDKREAREVRKGDDGNQQRRHAESDGNN